MATLGDRIRASAGALARAFAGTTGTTLAGRGPREAGPPRSSNGASSFHLIWDLPRGGQGARLVEVAATLEVLQAPRVEALHFWALQVDFEEDGRMWGGGHTGLQWNRRFPEGTAANWGGYASQERGGAILPGSHPELFAFPGDPNTMAFPWRPQSPYRLRVFRSPDVPGAWRASLIDLESGDETVLRDLFRPGGLRDRDGRRAAGSESGYLCRPMTWSEVFADCDAPSVIVRWHDLSAVREDGTVMKPQAVTVNYQAWEAGGCPNTCSRLDPGGRGVLQVTNAPRETGQGSKLELG